MRTAVRLAIAGGPPAVAPGSHVRWPQITDSDRAALARVLDSGELYGPNAPETVELEREWAAYVGARFALLTNSGTAALHCAVVAAGVRAGDEVIVPAFSFVATPMAVLQAGAVPVFCDIDPRTYTLDPRLIEERVTERTRAVMPVHAHGLPADMDEIRAIAARHGLPVIEDAAQAHGAMYRGVPVGRLGHAAAFSLNGSKLLAAGEGGLFVTDDETALRTARRLAIFGEDTPPTGPGQYRAYWSHGLGWNYRAHELTAALARSGLRRLDRYVATAQRNAEILTRGLAELPGFVPPEIPEDRTCVFYRYRIRIDPGRARLLGRRRSNCEIASSTPSSAKASRAPSGSFSRSPPSRCSGARSGPGSQRRISCRSHRGTTPSTPRLRGCWSARSCSGRPRSRSSASPPS